MSDNNDTSFKLDLDSDGFVSGANSAQQAIQSVANTDLSGLLSTIEEFGPVIGIVVASALVLGEAFTAAFDAERIQAVNQEFEILSKNAGQASSVLKEGLVAASGGLVTETDLMQAANKSLIEFQGGVSKLPQLMELARKSALVMGGDTIEKFNQLSQAIASGDQRGLKQAGIILDVQKAYQDYATSIGVTTGELSKAGQQQALMNAALAEGNKAFAGIDPNMKQATDAWTRLKVAISEFGEAFQVVIGNLTKGVVGTALNSISSTIKEWGNDLKAAFGSGADQAAAKVEVMKVGIQKANQELASLEQQNNALAIKGSDEVLNARIAKLKEYVAQYQQSINQQKIIDDQLANQQKTQAAEVANAQKNSNVDPTKHLAQIAAFNKEKATLDAQSTALEIKNMQTVAQAEALYKQQQQAKEQAYSAQIDQINAKVAKGDLTVIQGKELVAKVDKLKKEEMVKNEQDLLKMRLQALQTYQNNSQNVFEGIGRGFETMSERNQQDLHNFGKIGTDTANAFSGSMSGAFASIGNGSKTATQALGDAFEGMAGKMASQYGQVMFLASIWPPNPVGLAAGAALMTLGGALSGGGSSGSSSAGVSSSSASSAAATTPSTTPAVAAAATTAATPSKTVTINVQGNIMSNTASARWLVDQVRASSDATAFTVQSVGGGFGG